MTINKSSFLSRPFLYKAVSVVMILSLVLKLIPIIYTNLFSAELNTYGYTEFLINYSGGFVRRGLSGEFLMWITSSFGIQPQYIILALCFAAYYIVFKYFFKQFKAEGYSWWIIFSPLLCGYVYDIVRKDYILYVVAIGIFLLIKRNPLNIWRQSLAILLAVFGIFMHEAFFFWGIPLFALSLLTNKKHKTFGWLSVIITTFVFALMCCFKGNEATAHAIIKSWNNILLHEPLVFTTNNSIGALSWDTLKTIWGHLRLNIYPASGYLGLIYWPFLYLVVYYFISFFFCVFKPTKDNDKNDPLYLSVFFLIVSICMSPLFIFLSCDYGRLFQHAAVISFITYFTFGKNIGQHFIITKLCDIVSTINHILARLVPPSKGLLAIMLLTIGISPCWFNLNSSLTQSPLGSIGFGLIKLAIKTYQTIL